MGYMDHEKKTGAAPIPKPKYFDDINVIRAKQHSVNPAMILDSNKPLDLLKAKGFLKKKAADAGTYRIDSSQKSSPYSSRASGTSSILSTESDVKFSSSPKASGSGVVIIW
ncbi:hypothetical protein QYM36_001412 [Artemia franciscana]|uniref:Uncharacterized protein n=1 Tax=Artemia franciscana TaxID=6661 RepID=A0AA88LFM8_ARTSF|nr:hypothetical protein QYM36_001412 [Artemia franciscana]KAK2724949.1 hypothetical protein QYM36_001412 [Artemia franciscana]KAK2724950.1 hypothetical protein QYM36_001412 [Artemia franciscana]